MTLTMPTPHKVQHINTEQQDKEISTIVVAVPKKEPAVKELKKATPPKLKRQPEQPPVRKVAPQPQVITGCGDNFYANFIYMHESGCSPSAVNSIGCRGIGQACPGSKLPCGADYACQNAYFTRYALQAYGSWANAYNFWIANRWW